MPRFKALNESSSSEEEGGGSSEEEDSFSRLSNKDISPEERESKARKRLYEGLKFLGNEKREEARDSLNAALDLISPLTKLKPVSAASTRENVSKVASKIEYSSWKNLGLISKETDNPDEAISSYEKALDIDSSDSNLWQQLGLQALKADKYYYAAQCFQDGLEQQSDHWGCIECLCVALFLLGNYPDCVLLISKAVKLRNDYEYGFVIRDLIFERDPWCRQNQPGLFDERDHQFYITEEAIKEFRQKLFDLETKCRESRKPETLPVIEPKNGLKQHTWEEVGKAIVFEYKRAASRGMLPVCPLATSKWKKQVTKESVVSIKQQQPETTKTAETCTANLPIGPAERAETNEKPQAVCDEQKSHTNTENKVTIPREADELASAHQEETEGEVEEEKREEETEGEEAVANSSALSSTAEDSEAQSATDEPTQITHPSAPIQKEKKKKWGRKGSAQSVFKRRSSRHVPGFQMEDDYLCASKPIPLGDRLRGYLPFIFSEANCPEAELSKKADEKLTGQGDKGQSTEGTVQNCPEDINRFLDECNEMHMILVLRAFVWKVAELSKTGSLSSGLETSFVDVFKLWKDSQQLRTPWDKHELTETRKCAWTFLLFLEVTSASPWRLVKTGKLEDLRNDLIFVKYYNHVQLLSQFGPKIGEDWEKFELRSKWVKAQVLGYTSIGGGNALQHCLDWFEEFKIPNVQVPTHHMHNLTSDVITAKILQADKSKLLSDVENDFAAEKFETVVDVLFANLSKSKVQISEGSDNAYSHHRILCLSLLKLKRVKEASEWLGAFSSVLLQYFVILGADGRDKWVSWAVDLVALWEECLKLEGKDGTSLDASPRNLAEIIIRIIESEKRSRAVPVERSHRTWILLYRLAKHCENKILSVEYMKEWCKSMDSHKEVLPRRSLMILWQAHAELGHRRMCTGDKGSVLLLFAEELMDALKNRLVNETVPSGCIDDALNAAEQCFYCLYNYPQKRKRHLEEHNSEPMELSWTRAHLIFEFVRPEQPCEFDQFRSETISLDAVQLLHQIESVVPPMLKPDDLAKQMSDYILGNMEESPQLGFPNEPIVGELYHLLADYYLKSQDFPKALQYYTLDLCVWSSRFDSWAGLALAWLGNVQAKMDSVEISFKIPWMEMEDSGQKASFCFQKALEMQPGYPALLLEYGSVSYQLHSYFSRILKRSEAGRCYVGRKERSVRDLKLRYLGIAKKQYMDFLSTEPDSPEAHLAEYFLGKIEEKLESPLINILPHYHRAAQLLYRDGGRCPEKIRYNGPQKLSLEMLEIHYRTHAVMLKRIEKLGIFTEELAVMEAYADLFRGDPVSRSEYSFEFDHEEKKAQFIDVGSEDFVKGITDVVKDTAQDVGSILDGIIEKVVAGEKVLYHSADAMNLVIRRFSNHYKAYRRLAIAYCKIPFLKNVPKAEAILWGSEKAAKTGSLFVNRRPTNLFEGIWRIPQDEIDRYGSFASHVLNNTDLLLDVLKWNSNPLALLDAANHLSRPPDLEKKFISEEDRKGLLRKALEHVVVVAEEKIKICDPSNSKDELVELCCKIYRMWNSLVRVQNKLSWKFAKLMCLLYEKLNPGIGNQSTIDQVAAFCKILSEREKSRGIREEPIRKKRTHTRTLLSSPEKRSTASSADEGSPNRDHSKNKYARTEPYELISAKRLAFGAPPLAAAAKPKAIESYERTERKESDKINLTRKQSENPTYPIVNDQTDQRKAGIIEEQKLKTQGSSLQQQSQQANFNLEKFLFGAVDQSSKRSLSDSRLSTREEKVSFPEPAGASPADSSFDSGGKDDPIILD